MNQPALELENVSKSYERGAIQAVRSISLTVRKGELFGLLGPNGAGKTTTLKLAAGIMKPDSGVIRIAGIDINEEPRRVKKIIGYAASDPLVYEKMTGRQFLFFIARVFKLPKEAGRLIDELGEQFEIKEMYSEVIASYPPGIKQKLSLVAVFIHSPEIVILDEPFNGLDPRASSLLQEKLRAYASKGKTVFLSTYIMEIAEKLCRTVGIMRKGELIAANSVSALKRGGGKKRASLEEIFLELTG